MRYYHKPWSVVFQIMACHLFSANPSPDHMLTYCQLDTQLMWKLWKLRESKCEHFLSRICIWKCCVSNVSHFVQAWHWALSKYYSDLMLSQAFQSMAVQLSKKAALPLAKIIATASCRSSKTGPWLCLSEVTGYKWYMNFHWDKYEDWSDTHVQIYEHHPKYNEE